MRLFLFFKVSSNASALCQLDSNNLARWMTLFHCRNRKATESEGVGVLIKDACRDRNDTTHTMACRAEMFAVLKDQAGSSRSHRGCCTLIVIPTAILI
jgi:hypothetical protein